nr:cation-translocating P-type ATPase [Scopulibacillus daqui]
MPCGNHSEQCSQTLTIQVSGMDCPSCALTIKKGLLNIVGIQHVNVNYNTGKVQMISDGTVALQTIETKVSQLGYAPITANEMEEDKQLPMTFIFTAASGVLLALGYFGSFIGLSGIISDILYFFVLLVGGYKPAKSAFYSIKNRSLDMNVLMIGAAAGSLLIGQFLEGAMIVWLFSLGNALQNKSLEKTRSSIKDLMNLAPAEAWLKKDGELIRTPVEAVSVGDIINIKPGEKVPLDGRIISGTSTINQAPITGESIPADKQPGDPVYAGTINESGALQVKVAKRVKDSALSNIIHMVEEAQEQKAPTQAFLDKFAAVYTPAVFCLAITAMILPPLFGWGAWSQWFYKGLELLVIACPCALVISTPVAIVSAIGNAAKQGVLIKSGACLETAGKLKALAFDKTGTLTEGIPKVAVIKALNANENDLLAVARTIEEHSNHPIAKAIVNYTKDKDVRSLNGSSFSALAGKGVQATVDGEDYYAGKPELFEELGISLDSIQSDLENMQNEGLSLVVIAKNNYILGYIGVSDNLRDVSVESIRSLEEIGVQECIMLTGDNKGTARKIAEQANIGRYYANLLPEDKARVIKALQKEGKMVGMVGDGINDAPALAASDIGIAMGGAGTDTSIETADIVLMADNLEKLPYTMKLSRKALSVIKQNIWFSILIKLAAFLLIFPGFLTLWMAVFSDTGAALLVILNSMRLLLKK